MAGSRMRIARLSAALFLTVAAMTVAQTAEDEPLVADGREFYVVGFAELSAFDLPPEYRYIATSLPRLIAESFDARAGETMRHTYSPAELESYAEYLISGEVNLALRALSGAVRQRDALLFEKNVSADRKDRAEQAVADARATLDALSILTPPFVEIQSEKQLQFWSGKATGRLLSAVPVNSDLEPDPQALEAVAQAADLDLLIWGTIEAISQGYLTVAFHAYSPYGAEIRLDEARTTALPSDIGQDSEIMAGEIAAALLGRAWGSITVRTDVSDAAIFVNDQLAGFREARASFLPPGVATIEVSANGYRTERRTVDVIDRQTTVVMIELEPVSDRLVRIESAPADADVYVDSVWVGRTPIELRVGGEPLVVRVRHDGYLESRFVVTGDSPDRIARALLPDSLSWSNELREKRDGLYRSLTWFVLSVPVTMILNGVYQNVLSAFPPIDGGELTEENRVAFGQLGNIFYWASNGALLVNLGLLVNVGINLFDYLEVGEGAHNQ